MSLDDDINDIFSEENEEIDLGKRAQRTSAGWDAVKRLFKVVGLPAAVAGAMYHTFGLPIETSLMWGALPTWAWAVFDEYRKVGKQLQGQGQTVKDDPADGSLRIGMGVLAALGVSYLGLDQDIADFFQFTVPGYIPDIRILAEDGPFLGAEKQTPGLWDFYVLGIDGIATALDTITPWGNYHTQIKSALADPLPDWIKMEGANVSPLMPFQYASDKIIGGVFRKLPAFVAVPFAAFTADYFVRFAHYFKGARAQGGSLINSFLGSGWKSAKQAIVPAAAVGIPFLVHSAYNWGQAWQDVQDFFTPDGLRTYYTPVTCALAYGGSYLMKEPAARTAMRGLAAATMGWWMGGECVNGEYFIQDAATGVKTALESYQPGAELACQECIGQTVAGVCDGTYADGYMIEGAEFFPYEDGFDTIGLESVSEFIDKPIFGKNVFRTLANNAVFWLPASQVIGDQIYTHLYGNEINPNLEGHRDAYSSD